eukprot:46356_1
MLTNSPNVNVDIKEQSQPLLTNSDDYQINTIISSHKWTKSHTILAIMMRMCGEINIRSLAIYYRDYQLALQLDSVQFSYIIICSNLGCAATMIFPFIKRLLTLKQRITIFSFLCGLFAILLFIIPSQTKLYLSPPVFTLTYCCFIALFFGICFIMCRASIIDLASDSVHTSKQGQTIGLLELSWTFAALLYFVVGYMIEYINWWSSFVIFGSILCVLSAISHYVYKPFNLPTEISNSSDTSTSPINLCVWFEDIKIAFSNQTALLIFLSTFIMSICNGSFSVIVVGVWMEDIFMLTPSHVAWVSLTVFVAELIGCLTVSSVVDIYGPVLCGYFSFACTFAAGLITLIGLNFNNGNPDIGGIFVAVAVIFLLYLGWETFFILNQILCIKHSNNNNEQHNASFVILINYVSYNLGLIIGTYVAPVLWKNGKGLFEIGIIWIVTAIVTTITYSIIKFKNKPEYQNIDSV